ncbi:N-acetyltransferase [Deinococcus roseus]|uniref:Acetoin utilization protein AcuA n=1 Tax=Deinococcus roseus TaxID=392414 RepID=A0ABQ2D2S3_9DEIO|nr:N-acetyltransferase [Deinococcus roseus]GGJ41312.1 acetoin utilization protein AcuA [Deinococcus roseus]
MPEFQFVYPTPTEMLEHHRLHPDLKVFRPAHLQHRALIGITQIADGSVGTVLCGEEVVCYATLHPPDHYQRFGEATVSGMLELGAVESAPEHRSQRLARRLLEVMLPEESFQQNIIIATLYHWHYDLENTGLSTYAYRRLLEKLYSRVGFEVMKTDDPEISSYPGNALMVRMGREVPEELCLEFERLRFLRQTRGLDLSQH